MVTSFSGQVAFIFHMQIVDNSGVHRLRRCVLCMTLILEDWYYAGEGKIRIALANLNRQSETFGSVLLLQKGGGKEETKQQTSADNDVKFIKSTMLQWYSINYVFGGVRSIALSDGTIEEILNRIANNRPLSRISKGPSTILQNRACLQCNYSLLHRQLPPNTMLLKDELTFELKVKCGLVATTPFVVGSAADVKLHMSRYRLMQLYKQANANSNANSETVWGKFAGINDYDPLDMFSGCPARIRVALCTLLTNPQNNLRISLNSAHIYGWDKQDPRSLLDCLKESTFVGSADSSGGGVHGAACDVLGQPGHVIDALSSILSEETVLRRLHDMQKLDLLDSEGAAVVYARLVDVAGSTDSAMELLEQHMFSHVDPDMLTQIEMEYQEDETVGECLSIARTLYALRLLAPTEMGEAEQQARLAQVSQVVGRATADQCLYLLQLWMLALIAKDASVMVTVRRVRVSVLPAVGHQVGDMWVSPQGPTHCGTAYHIVKLCDDDVYEGVVYTVGLIDLGLKSLDKAWKKAEEDANVCRVVRNSLSL